MSLVGQVKNDYENRIKNLERSLNAEQSRRRQYGFFNKQLSAQIKKLQAENAGFQKELNAVKKCSSCECLDFRRKQGSSLETLQVSIPASRSVPHTSTNTLTPVDPEHPPEGESVCDIRYLQDSNESLKRCVESLNMKLQKMTQAKIREVKQWEEKLLEREQQINRLHIELENLKRKNSAVTAQETVSSDVRVNSLLLERRQLVEKVQMLEERLRNLNETRDLMQHGVQSGRSSRSGCDSCKRRFNSWDNLTRLEDTNWDYRIPSPSSQPFAKTDQLQYQVQSLKNKIKEQEKNFEAERSRMISKETLLVDEKKKISRECEKAQRRCEALEIELAKRRHSENLQRSSSSSQAKLFSSDSAGDKSSKNTVQHLQNELTKAHRKIEQLESFGRRKFSNKDLDSLREELDELEFEKRECERRLATQNTLLKQLEDDIHSLLKEKAKYTKRCAELETAVNKKYEENEELSACLQGLREKVAEMEESHAEVVKLHSEEIEAYRELLKQKDAERGIMLKRLCSESAPVSLQGSSTDSNEKPFVTDLDEVPFQIIGKDFEGVKKSYIKLLDEKKKLQKEVNSLTVELENMRAALEERDTALANKVEDNDKIVAELSGTKTTIAEMQSKINNSEKAVQSLQADVSKFEYDCARLKEELDKEKLSSLSLKTAVTNLEELLTDKNCELTTLTYQLQRANDDIHRLRTKNFDLETDLTVNSRELKGTRSKLERLKSKVKELEREARGSPLRVMSLPSPTTKAPSLSPVLMSTPTDNS